MKWTMRKHLLVGLAGALSMMLLLTADASALPPNERTRWMAGMGFLLGQAKIDNTRGIESNWTTGITPQLRFGRMVIKERLLLSFENKQWTEEQGRLPGAGAPSDAIFIKYQVGSQIYALALTAFPGKLENLSGGFYVNAGIGPAVARVDSAVVDTLGSGEDPTEAVKAEWGVGYFIGGGYEFRFLESVAAGLSFSYVYSSIKGDVVRESRAWPIAFTLNWYF